MANWISGISKHHRGIRRNIFIWCSIYLIAFLAIIGRLFWLQVVETTRYRKLSDDLHVRVNQLPGQRGRILDRNLDTIAHDDESLTLYADPSLVTYPNFVAEQLAPVLNVPGEQILAQLTKKTPLHTIKSNLDPDAVESISRLQLPGIQLRPAGFRYRVGINPGMLPHSESVQTQLSRALGISPERLAEQIGQLSDEPSDAGGRLRTASRVVWLAEIVSEETKAAVERLHFSVTFQNNGPSYSLVVDPNLYTRDNPLVPAEHAARQLAPLLGMKRDALARELLYKTRFTVLRRKLPHVAYERIAQLRGTLFVVEPGKLPDIVIKGNKSPLQSAVDRLYDMINDPKKPEIISRDAIRAKLLPGAPPGPLAVRYNVESNKPLLSISRRLFAMPIDGVIYGLPGIGIQTVRRRDYPYGKMASATLGFINDRHQGAFGLEASQEDTLRAIDGEEVMEIAGNVPIPEPEYSRRTEPVDGHDIVLTLDLAIQQATEEELAKAVQSSNALGGQCVVMNPNNGEILALATCPSWDANSPGNTKIPLVNGAVSNYYEPGSTFKMVAALAAMEEKLVRPGQIFLNCRGSLQVGKNVVHDSHGGHGAVDLEKYLRLSCNPGAATLALQLGPARFLKWCERLGFGQPTGIELANESRGSLNKNNIYRARITLANMGFGQSMTVTPLQLAAAYAVIANGGKLVKPHLLKGRQNDEGVIVPVDYPATTVATEKNTKLILSYLEGVVKEGTGTLAAIPGYRVAGKTGTAQKPTERGFRSGKYIASFIGIMPVEKPQLVVLAIIDEPKNGYYGGTVAAPVMREVGRRALQYLNIPPSVPVQTLRATGH